MTEPQPTPEATRATPAEPGPAAAPRAASPGEARRLERPPSDRYRTAAAPLPRMARPRIGRALAGGLAVALGVAVVIALLRAILAYGAGIVIVAIVGGWLIGIAVRGGAWGGRPHERSLVPHLVAAACGVAAWLFAAVGAWLVAMALLPGSARSFPERLAGTPFIDWLTPQLGALDAIELLLLVAASAWCARTRGLEPRDGEASGG